MTAGSGGASGKSMATRFTTYAYPASPVTYQGYNLTPRTKPDRLIDFVNVKDWGATGDGVTDDTPFINNAIDYAYQLGSTYAHGSIIFFPPGNYYIGSPPLFCDRDYRVKPPGHQAPIYYIGAGRDVTTIFGNHYTGNPIDSDNNSFLLVCGRYTNQGNGTVVGFRDLSIFNFSTKAMSGALDVEASGNRFHLQNVHLKGFVAYNHSANSFGNCMRDCLVECSRPITAANAATRSPLFDFNKITPPTGGSGDRTYISNYSISIGAGLGQGSAINCQFVGFDVGIALSQISMAIIGCSFSRCSIGILPSFYTGSDRGSQDQFGNNHPDPGRWFYVNGLHLCSNRVDRCTWGISMAMAAGFVAANAITGKRSGDQAVASPYDPVPIQSMYWDPTTHQVTVTTGQVHNINLGGNPKLQLAWYPQASTWTKDPYGFVTVTGGSKTTFTYAGPSTRPGSFSSGTWNYPLEYALCLIGGISMTMIVANAIDEAEASSASFSLTQLPTAGWVGYDNSVWAMRGAHGWTGAFGDNGSFDFKMCGMAGANNNPSQFVTFNQLPGVGMPNAGGSSQSATEGLEFTVTDATEQRNFGGIVGAYLTLSADANQNTTTLTFASVPAEIIAGMKVYASGPDYVYSNATVQSKDATHVYILPGTIKNIPAGTSILFGGGGSNHYKIRYDGSNWIRVG
jgi:hypothetical protein